MPSIRAFSAEEVDALIPTLQELVARQLGWAREINALLKAVQQKVGKEVTGMEQLQPVADDDADLAQLKTKSAEAIVQYENGWTDVQALGAVVKDPRAGVLDFWGLHEGRFVWLCWLYGEHEVKFFHELDQQASGRKPLGRFREEPTVRRNDAPLSTRFRHLN